MNNLEKMFYNVGKAGERMSKKMAEKFNVVRNIDQSPTVVKKYFREKELENCIVITRNGEIFYTVEVNYKYLNGIRQSKLYFIDGFNISEALDEYTIYTSMDDNYISKYKPWDLFENAFPFYNANNVDNCTHRYGTCLPDDDIIMCMYLMNNDDLRYSTLKHQISAMLYNAKDNMRNVFDDPYYCHIISPNDDMEFAIDPNYTDMKRLAKEVDRYNEIAKSAASFGQTPDSKFTQEYFATITIPDHCISEFINTSNIGKFLADCEEYDNTDELVDYYKGLVRDNNGLLFYIRVFSELLDKPWEELVKKHTPLSPSEIIMMSEKNMKDFLRAYMGNSKDDISEWYGISKTTAYRLKNKIIKELGIVVDKK